MAIVAGSLSFRPNRCVRIGRSGHPEVSGADQPCEYQSQHPIHRPRPAQSIAFARFGRKLCPPERRRWIASSYAWLDSGHRVTRLGAETIVLAQVSVAIAVALVVDSQLS